MYIAVKDPKQWEKLTDLDLTSGEYGITKSAKELFGGLETCEFVLEGDWHISGFSNKSPLHELVLKIRKRLGKRNCVILADFADADNYPVYDVIYAADDTLKNTLVNYPMESIDIRDTEKWMKTARLQDTDRRLEYLAAFPPSSFDFARRKIRYFKN